MILGALLCLATIEQALPDPASQYEENLEARHPAIRYWDAPLDDPVSRLAEKLGNGSISLDYREDGTSYLASLLKALDIHPESQLLVFSKTSLQRSRISPDAPRAIYFGDDVAVGFVPGGDAIELAAYDPRRGGVFFTLATEKSATPRFERPPICLSCHHDVATLGVPGMYVGSVTTTTSGRPRYAGSIVSDHRTPFDARWGGWFVDGGFASPHRGNAAASSPQGEALMSLRRDYAEDRYLESSSDVVALMVLDHQTQMANYLVRLGWESRTGEGPTAERIDEVVRYMTFVEEAPLDGPVTGASRFADTFVGKGPRDSEGRSLRELELTGRLFRYPLTYMIGSDVFAALPQDVRATLLERLHAALMAKAATDPNAAAAIEIAGETVESLPDAWKQRSPR